MSRATIIIGAALLVAGCAPGHSIVTVTVTADASMPVGPIATLAVTPSDAAGHKGMVTVPVHATVPPSYVFSLRFDATVKGNVHLALTALDDGGMAIGSGAGDVTVTPSHTMATTINLGRVVPPPTGATLAFTTQPMDALAKTTLPAVRVTVLDAGGNPVTSTNVPITLAIGTNPSSGTLAGTLTVGATGGVASFADLSIDQPGMGYTLVASAPGTTRATSNAFNVKTTGFVASNAGLSGGIIHDLVMDPKHSATLYAATEDNGVWKTIDAGATWTRAALGLPRHHSIDALAIDPVTTTTIYASCGDAGVYKTTDAGNSWTQVYTGLLQTADFAAIAVDPTHPMHVYVAGASRTVVYSANGGTGWTSIPSGATYGSGPRSIAIHPTTGDVWLAQFGDGIWKMPFGGASFTLMDGTAPNVIPGTHPYMKCVAFSPADPNFMIATGDLQPSSTVFWSADGGANWTAATSAPAHAPVRIASFLGPGLVPKMYGAIPEEGVVSTPTDLKHWDYGSAGLGSGVAVVVDPAVANRVFAANRTGVFKSTDAFNFTADYTGLIGHGMLGVAVDPRNGNKLYVGMRNGLFRSTDGAQSWSPPTSAMPGAVNVYAIAVDFTDDTKMYLATDNWTFHSSDFGATWSAVTNGGATVAGIFSLAAAPSASGTFYAGGGAGDAYSIAGAATMWSAGSTGLPANKIVALAVDPSAATTVFAATSASGVYKTTNGGAGWAASNGGLGSMNLDGLALASSSTIYVATADKGVYKSNDAGASWSAASTGLGSMNVLAIAVAPSQPTTVYAATPMGVYQSLDGGATWASYSAGLASNDIAALAVDPTNPLTVYAATWEQGLFKNVTQ